MVGDRESEPESDLESAFEGASLSEGGDEMEGKRENAFRSGRESDPTDDIGNALRNDLRSQIVSGSVGASLY